MSERRAELQAVFTKHDKDSSGDVDTKELRHIFLALGVEKTAEQIDKLLVNSSGTLSFDQFESLFCTSRLEDAFRKYDTDGSGNISVDEIRKVMHAMGYKLSKAQCAAMVRKADVDGDGEISLVEFIKFFKNLPLASMEEVAAYWASGVIATDCGSDIAPTVPPPGCGLLWWQSMISGGAGGVLSRTLTAPLEKIKIAAQTGTSTGGGMARELMSVYRTQGAAGLFAGNATNCIRVFPTAGITCTVYVNLLARTPADTELDAMEPLYRMGCAGAAAIVGNAITYPLDLVRTRLTVQGTGFLPCIRSIYAGGVGAGGVGSGGVGAGGMGSFYAGLLPTLAMVAPFIAMQNATIDILRDQAMERELEPSAGLLFGIGCVAGVAAQSVVYPLDVIRRRMQMQPASSAAVADSSIWLTARGMVRTTGWRTLYAGIGATFLKTMPSVGIVAAVTGSLNIHYKKQNKLNQSM